MMILEAQVNLANDQIWKHFYVHVSTWPYKEFKSSVNYHGRLKIRLSAEACKLLKACVVLSLPIAFLGGPRRNVLSVSGC